MPERLKNTVRERRAARGWSMNTLAEKVGTTVGTINRIETGETKLLHDLVPALGEALGCAWRDLFVDEDSPEPTVIGLADDAAPFIPGDADPLSAISLGQNRVLWTAKSSALDAIGIAAGQPFVVNISREAIERASSLDPVIIQVIDPEYPLRAVTLLRQFIEPDLFITNSAQDNGAMLSRRNTDIRIKGIVENVISTPRSWRG